LDFGDCVTALSDVNKTADFSEFVIDICLFDQRIKFADSLAHKF
jgi:hypothetical protein